MTKELISSKQVSRPLSGPVGAAIARDLLRVAKEFGEEPSTLLNKAGLAHLAPSLLSNTGVSSALPPEAFTRLYAHCTWALDEHAARQEGREPLTKPGLDMLCRCLITCRTLREAIGRADQFGKLLAPRLSRLTLDTDEGIARIRMPTIRRIRNACAYLSDLTGLSTYHRLFGWLIGEDIPLLDAALRYPLLFDKRTISHLMPCLVRHGSPENGFRFPAYFLDRPIVRTSFELEQLLVLFPFDMEAPVSKDTPLSERIGHFYCATLSSSETPPAAGALAKRFGISLATLKRRLSVEGTSLAQIKNTSRLTFARQLLADPHLTITEVGRRTQFSDTGAFRRAFHSWTGFSPSAWRKSILRP